LGVETEIFLPLALSLFFNDDLCAINLEADASSLRVVVTRV
jgi:hypothetical protein